MKTITRTILALAAMLVATVATAGEEHIRVQAWKLDSYTSTQGESKLDFIRRVGAALQTWTTETGMEGCGTIGADDHGGYAVTLYTMHSQVVCAEMQAVADGYASTGETIHSHPTAPLRKVFLTDADHDALKAVHMFALANHFVKSVPVEQFHFSGDDFAGGPGYLVLNGRLLYQHGEGTEVQL